MRQCLNYVAELRSLVTRTSFEWLCCDSHFSVVKSLPLHGVFEGDVHEASMSRIRAV